MTLNRLIRFRLLLELAVVVITLGLVFGAPPAIAGALTDTAENAIVDAVLRGQALGAPATPHWGLTTDTCTDSGSGTEPAGGAYARVSYAASMAINHRALSMAPSIWTKMVMATIPLVLTLRCPASPS